MIGGIHKEMESQYCNVTEAGREILKAIGDTNTWNAVEHKNQDFKYGAMWGMAWAMNHIYAYAPKFTKVERYPCDHCGMCPVWVAATEGKEFNSLHKLLKACFEQKCELVAEIVEQK